ncbi:FAD-binding protein [Acidovorax sp. Leaf76]|uniref:FAD-binding oxidoreductase n=1 Tax=unclassified Acidovorax TaxID=2684926 RepID=UPI0006FDA02D|nr:MULTISPECIES: FAD-binding oxidoreductase [unclassified Acidovorax]KQO22092.1 FAD-binding protein [Acidovorax sp. Leaf76]KQO35163.1 FAD-binding protein [Acidovorax sp. Leaf84]KQS34946.1 FAD-binding protein [Acidovorax sp. Leaf191]
MTNITTAHQLPEQLPGLDWIADPLRVGRLSQDFAWFSPVLKRELAGKRGDVAVRPRTEDEIRQVVAACARAHIPITVRGSGTGNYGQSTPLQGGVILDLSGYNGFGWVRGGVGRAQAGIRLSEFDAQAKPLGQELRWLPSTYRSATLGGLFGGGFGGAGSINHGPLAAPGNVLAVRAMTVEPEPQVIELRGPEAMLLHHTYGTNGIVLELEVALTPAVAWTECIVTFTDFDAALDFADRFGAAPGLEKKEVCFLAAPIPAYFTSLAEHLPAGCHAVMLLVAPHSEDGMRDMATRYGGTVSYRKTADEVEKSHKTLLEYTWNHTTLHALKVDKTLTYIQSGFTPATRLEQVKALDKALGGEVMMHLEFLRTKEGAFNCSGLQLIRYSTEERLNQIMQIYRDHGVQINNPHVYIVEDGKQNNLDPAVVGTKQRFDPQGLLNPGKLRSWVPPVAKAA